MTRREPTDQNTVLAEIARICDEAVDSASRLEANWAYVGCACVLSIAVGRIQVLARKAVNLCTEEISFTYRQWAL